MSAKLLIEASMRVVLHCRNEGMQFVPRSSIPPSHIPSFLVVRGILTAPLFNKPTKPPSFNPVHSLDIIMIFKGLWNDKYAQLFLEGDDDMLMISYC